MASTYLTRAMNGNSTTTGTISLWVKRANLGQNVICSFWEDSSTYQRLQFDSQDRLNWKIFDNGTLYGQITSTAKFRDTNGWYHIVSRVDTTQSTSTDRVRLYVNGDLITSLDDTNYPTQNRNVKQSAVPYIGTEGTISSARFDGCMSHINYTDAASNAPTVFGETDASTGQWKINTSPSVTYGAKGFFILKDGNSGTDQSGNSNNFTVSGTLTNTEDCPSNVFCTYNKLGTNRTMSTGNTVVTTTNADFYGAAGTIGASSGKYYWEVKLTTSTYSFVGVDYNPGESFRNNTSSNTAHSYLIYAGSGSIYNNSAITSYGSAYSQGDIVGVAMDLDNSKLYFRKNGDAWFNSGDPTSGSTGTGAFGLTAGETYFPVVGDGASGYGAVTSTNFGNGYFGTTAISSEGTNASNNGKFEYDVPTGYTALSTKGLNE